MNGQLEGRQFTLNKENLYSYFRTMIHSSTKKPKYTSISTVKVADILGVQQSLIEHTLDELVSEGRLQKSKLQDAPHYEIYMLPGVSSPS